MTDHSLDAEAAAAYARWFACLADPTRVRVLHTVASASSGLSVGVLAERARISQSTCSHHIGKLTAAGFVRARKLGPTTLVTVNEACCVGLPHVADVVTGALAVRPSCPGDLPADVTVRPMTGADWPEVRRIYAEGIATGNATFETTVPSGEELDRAWLPGHRWVAVAEMQVAGWASIAPASRRRCYAGVREASVYVGERFRGRGVGKALIHRQVTEADRGGLWTLQAVILPENRASIGLHRSAGFRTIGVRERIGKLAGVWRDTVLLERRSEACCC